MPENDVKSMVKEALAEADAAKKKQGYKTTEFWLAAAASVAGMVVASGAIPADGKWGQIVGLVVVALASMGYSSTRGKVKAAGK